MLEEVAEQEAIPQTGEDEQIPEEAETPPSSEEEEEQQPDEEIDISFGSEPPPAKPDDSLVIRDMRKRLSNFKKQNRELREKLEAIQTPSQQPAYEPGPKPTLESCDYDSDAFEKKLSDWYQTKNQQQLALEKQQAEHAKVNAQWQQRVNAYNEKKESLNVADFEDAEISVQDNFDVTQQGIVIHGCDNPALVTYALGKNPAKLKELSQIKDPITFAFAVARLESQMKVAKRKKPAAAPEKVIKSTGAPSGSVDRTLERLREEAARTGDYTKLHQYKKSARK